ncbi:terminase gpA endonuclease subunit [Desulfoluna spongiiphila]|uniref:Phage terminase, large subunit GpA n=1 Tax=Desulfoluna spongiiphila TaxID=419481 RepID=A0A1G5CH38_9BACT|nr:terminase gpA endonuclease subunit [Desulfoluna spongiiphila]SCY01621.1 Phage terminase, large subunit GpA [Desulfoluna spongiiphila]
MTTMDTITFTEGERQIFKAKEKLTVSQWAEKYRRVTKGSAPGQWTNELTPYLVEPMDAWNRPWVQKIFLCFAPQTGKTQVAINCMEYAVDQDPGPAMYVMPDEKSVKKINRRQIIPSLKASPRTADLLSKKADDVSTYSISFTNGMDILMAWATSPAVLASESIRYLFFDEPGKYPEFSGKEADPFSLGEVRTNVYPFTKKILYFSTPADHDDGFDRLMKEEVELWYFYEALCPICGTFQKMEFGSIHWPKGSQADPRTVVRKKSARYTCTKCGMDWDDTDRDRAVKNGRWVPEKEIPRAVSVGYHLPSWYSPFVSFSEVAAAFLKGLKEPRKMMAFDTQYKAVSHKPIMSTADEDELLSHKTDIPPGLVPKEAIALTCGIDMQKSNFYFVVRAWDKDLTSWLIQYGTLSDWDAVEDLVFNTRYPVQDSQETMGIFRAALDTGGGINSDDTWSRTEEAYEWLRDNSRGVIFGIKGSSKGQLQNVHMKVMDKLPRSSKPIPGGLELRFLDTQNLKELLHVRLGNKEADPKTGRKADKQRFYLHSETDVNYAKQFLAEEKRRDKKTRKVSWQQIGGRANHLLDCEVYAAACADSSWMPSIRFLSKVEEKKKAAPKPKPAPKQEAQDVRQRITGNRNRPSWYNKR